MGRYRVPRPQECLKCGEQCYAYHIYSSTTTGREYPKEVYKCYWACNGCGRKFQTMERENDFITVDEVPDSHDRDKGIAYLEEN